MQLIGLALLMFVIWFGFGERGETTISAFDTHAFVMVLGGSAAAVMVSSTATTTSSAAGTPGSSASTQSQTSCGTP